MPRHSNQILEPPWCLSGAAEGLQEPTLRPVHAYLARATIRHMDPTLIVLRHPDQDTDTHTRPLVNVSTLVAVSLKPVRLYADSTSGVANNERAFRVSSQTGHRPSATPCAVPSRFTCCRFFPLRGRRQP